MKRFLPPLCASAVVAGLYLAGALEFIERQWLDTRFRLVQRPASGDVVLVDIDPESLRRLPVWPWPRSYHATLLDNLLDAGAARVGFDIDFSSRSAPEEDEELARSLATAGGRVLMPSFMRWQQVPSGGGRLVAVEPIPALRRLVELGSINIHPDGDGVLRRYGSLPGTASAAPSFAAALVSGARVPDRRFYVDYGITSSSIPRVSFVDVLTGQFPPDAVAGRTVIVGSTAVELGDQIAVPVTSSLPGPIVQALACESLRQGRDLQRSPAVTVIGGTLLLALLFGPWVARVSWKTGASVTLGVVAGVVGLSLLIQQLDPVILDTTPWVLTAGLVFLHGLVSRIDRQQLGLLAQRARLRRTQRLMHHVVENSFDAIVTLDNDGLIETMNPAARELFGVGADEAHGRELAWLIRSDDDALPMLAETPVEVVGLCRDGRGFPAELTVAHIGGETEVRRVAFIRDITERKAQQQALEHQATHDPLTSLPNRFLLLERVAGALEQATESGHAVAVLLADLDGFKEINDALGHQTGDHLLKAVARRLAAPLEGECTIARLGGDEFAVLMPRATAESAQRLSWTLIEALKTPFNVDGLSLEVDTSIGISLFPDHGTDAEALIQRADVAMYVAKRKKKGVATYSAEQDYNSIRHLTLRGDLRHAIQDDRLTLAYQPKVCAVTERVIGAEALLRWHHPQHGFIPPDEFIGMAEHSGLIRPLTQWVLDTALAQVARWTAAGRELRVAVNVSARNLLEEDLPSGLARLLERHRVPARLLTLEITESVLMEDPTRSLEVITRLSDLGVDISIDDFGTGYSSLGYLVRLPARELKIDRSFVMGMEHDPANTTIVRSMVELAHNLGLSVVAEGVEDDVAWARLREMGCDIGQGYFFARPMDAGALEAWLSSSGDPAQASGRPGGVQQPGEGLGVT